MAPPLQALRFAKLCGSIDVRVKVDEQAFEAELAMLKQLFRHDNDWPFFVRVTRVDEFVADNERLLELSQVREVVSDARASFPFT